MTTAAKPRRPPQTIKDADGRDAFVVLPVEDYTALVETAEDATDAAHAQRVRDRIAAGADEWVPADVVDRILDDESPVRVWREHRGLTQDALAKAVGVSRGFIGQIETGRAEPSLKTAAAIARVLGVDIDDLVAATEDEQAAGSSV